MAPDKRLSIDGPAKMKKHRTIHISSDEEARRRRLQRSIDGIIPAEPPVALSVLFRPTDAASLMLHGLELHYLPCLAGGRLAQWAAAAHAAVDLLASVPDVKVIARSDLESVLASESQDETPVGQLRSET